MPREGLFVQRRPEACLAARGPAALGARPQKRLLPFSPPRPRALRAPPASCEPAAQSARQKSLPRLAIGQRRLREGRGLRARPASPGVTGVKLARLNCGNAS